MKFNKRLIIEDLEGSSILSDEDILNTLKTLVSIRNGQEMLMILTILEIGGLDL